LKKVGKQGAAEEGPRWAWKNFKMLGLDGYWGGCMLLGGGRGLV